MLYFCYRIILFSCACLPTRIRYWIAIRLAEIYYLTAASTRRKVQANLRIILGEEDKDIDQVTLNTFRSFGIYLSEFFSTSRFTKAYLDQHVRILGLEHLNRALARGNGCLLVSGHYSNWELGATVVGRLGIPIVAITQMHKQSNINELFVNQRKDQGIEVRHTREGALATLRALRRNQPVAILGDRATGGRTIEVNLFDHPTPLPHGPWRIASDTGCPILPTFMHRDRLGYYTLEFEEPIEAPPASHRDERIKVLAEAFTQRLEFRIRKDPSQWAAFYPVWNSSKVPCKRPSSLTVSSTSTEKIQLSKGHA